MGKITQINFKNSKTFPGEEQEEKLQLLKEKLDKLG